MTWRLFGQRTFNSDEEAPLTNGGPSGVESHQNATGGVDKQSLFAETSALSQVNVRSLVVCCVRGCKPTSEPFTGKPQSKCYVVKATRERF